MGMKEFFVSVLNACVRNLQWGWRITICVACFCAALLFLKLSFRKKDDKHPLALGWFLLCLLSLFIAIVYVVV